MWIWADLLRLTLVHKAGLTPPLLGQVLQTETATALLSSAVTPHTANQCLYLWARKLHPSTQISMSGQHCFTYSFSKSSPNSDAGSRSQLSLKEKTKSSSFNSINIIKFHFLVSTNSFLHHYLNSTQSRKFKSSIFPPLKYALNINIP